jgi:hypothetical protein
MKTHISILVFATLLAAAGSLAAASMSETAHAYRVSSADGSGDRIVRGHTSSAVLESLYHPSWKLGDDVWVYRGFKAVGDQTRDAACSTLVITFTNGRVSDLMLVNDRALAVITKRIEAGKAAGLVAATAK